MATSSSIKQVNNSSFWAEVIPELRVDANGVGYASLKAAAKLFGITQPNLSKHFRGYNKNPSQLCQTLMAEGFEGYNISQFAKDGIPDEALHVISTYYAMDAGARCTEAAKFVAKQFGKYGWRKGIQQLVGYKDPVVDPQPGPHPVPLPSVQDRLAVIEMGANLLERLGGADDRTKLALKDQVRDILLEGQLEKPALPSGNGERSEWPISDRARHLGYNPSRGQLLAIGKVVAAKYRDRHNGQNPPKREQFVDGATRRVNCYRVPDLDILDAAIASVMSGKEKAA